MDKKPGTQDHFPEYPMFFVAAVKLLLPADQKSNNGSHQNAD